MRSRALCCGDTPAAAFTRLCYGRFLPLGTAACRTPGASLTRLRLFNLVQALRAVEAHAGSVMAITSGSDRGPEAGDYSIIVGQPA